ncbi:SPOR domain-containing protein [Burkholderia sp. WAC0059]|uniref:SPOR domain-containing protein n=1 Tax=Burkholderia sp. WAC0059 TaxID=2066022 RepID=UPI000C7E9A74|nr:SPOR domain-containing protein [Burkholderia sp. WAC0059]PLZ01011.1 SPOR domain-containing protein [Burkholderia sp. WAC0059]
MGIFSFGRKDDDAPVRRGAGSGRRAQGARTERRSRRPERADADAMLLDPTLPEKQRARRRLVGAIALVIAAIVILPMVLDSHPKPVTDDIAIDIPSRPADQSAANNNDTDAGAGMTTADNPATADAAATGASGSAVAVPSATAGIASPAAPGTTGSGSQQGARSRATARTPSRAPSNNPPQTQAQVSSQASQTVPMPPLQAPSQSAAAANTDSANATNADDGSADTDTGSPVTPPGARFAVQLGSFHDEASARDWVRKLKAAGVPAYTERRRQSDGTTLTLLRAGPFVDRTAASAAIAKVRAAGLMANANSGGAE